MPQYLIEVPHSPEECSVVEIDMDGARKRGTPLLAYCGCRAGIHTAWIIGELTAEEEAWGFVPALLVDTARVIAIAPCETDLDPRTT